MNAKLAARSSCSRFTLRRRAPKRLRLELEPLENRIAPAGALDPLFGNDGIVLVSQAPLTNWAATGLSTTSRFSPTARSS
jgi:hypothetical protein